MPVGKKSAPAFTVKRATCVGNVDGRKVYASEGGLAFGVSKSMPAGELYGCLTKGEARKLRKACRAAGFTQHAKAVRREW